MQDRRQTTENSEISPELLAQGRTQLDREIRLIEDWLAELEETSKDNPEAQAARKSYTDMIESRQELLESLKRHR